MSEIPMYPDEIDWREAYLESQAELYRVTTENERLQSVLDEIAKNAENFLAGGLPHFSRRDFASAVADRARAALRGDAR